MPRRSFFTAVLALSAGALICAAADKDDSRAGIVGAFYVRGLLELSAG